MNRTSRGNPRRASRWQDPANASLLTPTPAQQVGRIFRTTRESQNLSQEQLAALTRRQPGRVSRAMISAIERGRHLPGLEVMLTLSDALHISPAEILERLQLARMCSAASEGLTLEELERKASESFWAGQPRQAVSHYDAMLRRLDEQPPADERERRRAVATAELRRGVALRRCGATVAARGALERSIGLSDDLPDVQSQAYVALTALLVQVGCLPLARDLAGRAVELAAMVGRPQLLGWAWIEKGEVLAASELYERAHLAFVEARKWVRKADDHVHAIKVEGNIGACLQDVGRLKQARHSYQAAVELARKHQVPQSEALWLVELGRLSFREEKLEEADAHAARAARIAKPRDDLLTCFRAEWWRHRVQRVRQPGDRDRHRVAFLKRLYIRLEDHRGIEEVREFKRQYCSPAPGEGGSE